MKYDIEGELEDCNYYIKQGNQLILHEHENGYFSDDEDYYG
jgi:hypothetical protein